MRRVAFLALVAVLCPVFASPSFAEDAAAKAKPLPKGLAIGDTVPAFELSGLDGSAFTLAGARTITPAQALAAVQTAAKSFGGADVKPTDAIDRLPGLTKDGAVDPAQRVAFIQAAGHPFGLIATAASTADMKTIGDVTAWIEKSATAPIVLMVWSSGCPTCQLYEERVNDLFSKSGARLYLLAANFNDEPEAMKGRIEGDNLGWHVLLDRDAKVTDIFGGRRTPHVFVLDEKNALRYAGALDSDAAGTEPVEKRANWLQDALAAVGEGRGVDVMQTAPKG